jgi:hypothetical protein
MSPPNRTNMLLINKSLSYDITAILLKKIGMLIFCDNVYYSDLMYHQGLTWPLLYSSWIYNYLCNQCLSPLMLWVQISLKARCTTCDKICQWLAAGRWFTPGTTVSSSNKTGDMFLSNFRNVSPMDALYSFRTSFCPFALRRH